MSTDDETDAPPAPSLPPVTMDTLLFNKVIDIASATAESVTAAAAAQASVRSEIETMRVSMDSSTLKLQELVSEVNHLKTQRQNEIDDKRLQAEQENKVKEGKLQIWKDLLGKAVTPQTVMIIIAIFAAAFGLRISMPTPIGTLSFMDSDATHAPAPVALPGPSRSSDAMMHEQP